MQCLIKILLLSLTLSLSALNWCHGQEVEHNYKVGPKSNSCDSLKLEGITSSEMISVIGETNFRFDQSFRLTRRQGLKSGSFYSCDNQTGYLIIEYNKETFIYKEVEKQSWNELVSSSDPEGYYLDIRKKLISIP